MAINQIQNHLKRELWGQKDFRSFVPEIVRSAQIEIERFSPLHPNETKENPIQVIDFFSGAGGTSLGFAALNKVIPAFHLLGGCDINTVSASTYSVNYSTPRCSADIREIARDSSLLNRWLATFSYDPSKPLVLIGCAPCQGFTSHTKKRWSLDDDARNSLPFAFAEIVESLQPDVVLMENVPEFLGKKYWRYFEFTKTRLEENGYHVKASIYNAATFGVPQERFRAILIAMKKDFLLPAWSLSANDYRTVRDAIGMLPPVSAGVSDPHDPLHRSANHSDNTLSIIKRVPHDGGSRPKGVGPVCLDKTKGFSDVYGRLAWDRPSITITHYARNPASGRFSHPEQDRGLTMREAAILQSFPKGYFFSGKNDDIYRQIGEAVPPYMSAAIAANVLVELVSSPPSQEEAETRPRPISSPVSSSYSSVIAGIKTQTKKRKVFTCIDSFCGAGGLALGLQNAGFHLLFSFDIDEKCIQTIQSNPQYFRHKAEVADITNLLGGKLLEKCNLKRGELSLLAGGPPCQGFSIQRRGEDIDPRNQLVFKYAQLVDELFPRFFVMENVTGIAGKRGKTILADLIDRLHAIGYMVNVALLNAEDYGVPQRRRRYIIVGSRLDTHATYEYPAPIVDHHKTVRETIGDLPPPPEDGTDHPNISLHRRDRLSARNLARINAIGQGQGRDNLPEDLLAECHKVPSSRIGYRNVYGRMAWDDVAPTITARFDSFTRGLFGHPDQPRTISLREGALLQTFPADFSFVGNKVDIARQIGNAVPPLLGEAIGKSIMDSLQKEVEK